MPEMGCEVCNIAIDAISGKELHAGFKHIQGARHGFSTSVKTGEPMPLRAIILFNLIGFSLSLGQQNSLGHIAIAADPAQELSGVMIQHFPQPEFLFFFKRKWCISSISTMAAPALLAFVTLQTPDKPVLDRMFLSTFWTFYRITPWLQAILFY